MKIILGGATGLVGQEILEVLEELSPQVTEVIPAASERSIGRRISFRGKEFPVVSFEDAMNSGAIYAIFSAGSGVSREWAPRYAENGITVIDNSSAWRKDKEIPLVVPEVNAQILNNTQRIIANPNCSTIQLVVALYPLHKKYGLKRVVASTYQSVSGSGLGGIRQLEAERQGKKSSDPAYPHSIDMNALPQGGDFEEEGYTSEEMKLINETRKIMDLPELRVTATVVRIPVTGGHSESVSVELKNEFTVEEVRELLKASPNIKVEDDPASFIYPMPVNVRGSNYTHVGRIRRDFSVAHGLNIWIVADNLRKGAATNAVHILNLLTK